VRRGGNDRVVKLALFVVVLAAAAAAVAVATATHRTGDGTSSGEKQVAGTASRPTIAPADTSPLRLRGALFRPGERVRVTVNGEGRATKRVTASAKGTFVVTFAGSAGCNLTVVATGDEGSRASFQLSSFVCE
jgi:hypothetical protein